jgi:hypothetical protein
VIIALVVVVFSLSPGGGSGVGFTIVGVVCNFGVLDWLIVDEVVHFNFEFNLFCRFGIESCWCGVFLVDDVFQQFFFVMLFQHLFVVFS